MLILVLPILLSASLTIYAEMAGRRALVYIFKPLTTTLILAVAWLGPAGAADPYRWAILIGLLLSLAGDVLLMLPADRFVAGVAAFLAAHLAYLAAFTSHVPLGASTAAYVVVGTVVGAILAGLWRSLPAKMRAPLVLYGVVLGAMTAQAASQAILIPTPATAAAAVGAGLFLASDAALVTNRYARPFRLAPLAVLSTYYAAQTLIALSATVTPP